MLSQTASNEVNPLNSVMEAIEKLVLQSKVKTRVFQKILKAIEIEIQNQPALTKMAGLTESEKQMLGHELEMEILDEIYRSIESSDRFDTPTLNLVKQKLSSHGAKKYGN